MTKKHFIALANVVIELKPDDKNHPYYIMWHDFKMFLAEFCEHQNPSFNRQLWLDYIDGKCGPSGEKLK